MTEVNSDAADPRELGGGPDGGTSPVSIFPARRPSKFSGSDGEVFPAYSVGDAVI